MLTVAKVTARVASGYADYLEGKTTATGLGDYYLKDGERVEAPGRWVTGAGAVGGTADQAVSGEQLRELMAVRHPGTGRPLRAVGASGEAVAALDATFSAPKSVSAVWALADRDLRARIEQAHERAIARTLGYAAEEVAMVRERIDRRTVVHVKAADLVATSWRHTTARAVDGRPPDPQLHSHVLLHAAVRKDGRLVAIDSRAWLVHRRELGAAYRTELAAGLAALGFEIARGTGRGGRYFELRGVPQALIDQWSSRSHQIEDAIRARLENGDGGSRDRLSPAQDRLLRVVTRTPKQPHTTADLDAGWRTVAREIGVSSVEALRRARAPIPPAQIDHELLINALTEFDATFSEREARAVALECSAGMPIRDALAALRQAREEGQLRGLADGRLTTARHRSTERQVVATAVQLADAPGSPVDPAYAQRSLEVVNGRLARYGGALSAEQRRALELATGEQRVVMIEGQAGTGKSTVLQAVALAHQGDGRQVIVTSTAALAAQRLADDLAEAGVRAPAYSTAALRHAVRSGQLQLHADTTVIHDEAALASTREQYQLLTMVAESGARLVVVGDPEQSKPVGAGGLWPHIERELTGRDARVELIRNLRAQDPADRRDQKLFRDGEHEQALRGYADRHRIRVAPDLDAAAECAVRAAHADRRDDRDVLVIAQTSNERLDELNARAQSLRIIDGQLGEDSLAVPGRPYRLHPGDEIQIRHTINHPGHGLLRNGTTATVSELDADTQTTTLRLAGDEVLQLDRHQLEQADVRLAYVQHPFPAQGATSDTAHLIVAEHATREGSYVALTRARQTTHIHASWEQLTADEEQDPIERLATILGRNEPDLPSIATPLAREQQVQHEAADEGWPMKPTWSERGWVRRKPPENERERDNDIGREL